MNIPVSNLLQKGIALQRQGELAGAVACYSDFLRFEPQNTDALFYLAQTLCQQGNLTAGIELIKRAVALDPGRGKLHNLLGMALNAAGQPEAALASLNQAISLEPQLAIAHGNRGDVLLNLGRLPEAVETYNQALILDPGSIETWCNRGAALQELGRFEDAVASYRRAIALKPDFAEVHVNCGSILQRLGQPDEAFNCFESALAVRPNLVDALNGSGDALTRLGLYTEAIAKFDRTLMIVPDSIAARVGRAGALMLLGRYLEALEEFEVLAAKDPAHADAHAGCGAALNALDRVVEALAACERALAIQPDHVDALTNRGNALYALHRYGDALGSYESALALTRDNPEIQFNRGCALEALGRQEEALETYERVLSAKPEHQGALANSGAVLMSLGRHLESLEAYDRLLATQPDDVEALYNRGTVLMLLDRLEESLASFDRALAIDSGHARSLGNRANALLELGRYRDALQSYRRAIAIESTPDRHTNLIFALNFDPELTAVELQAERASWGQIHGAPLSSEIHQHDNEPNPDRRLRIGYMSGHFRHQSATYSFAPVILGHDRQQYEVICYSDTRAEDELTTKLRDHADKWHRIVGLSDARVADLVRSDEIDILVDTVGHMKGNRLLVFARKPAPVQVCAWGEPTGTGLATMDYVFSDPVHTIASERHLMVEEVFDLPNFIGYWSPEPLPEPGPLPALTHGHVTFGSFNRFIKIQEPVLRCWAAILRSLPNATLVLKVDLPLADQSRRSFIDRIIDEEGIDRTRVTLLGRTDRLGHFRAYQQIDIALDPFPHGGAMSTLDGLWMGVPVVTWPGRIISARLAAASLTVLGMTDFIAPDPKNYVDLAVAKANDLSGLSALRNGLRERMTNSVLGNSKRYTQAVEDAYREIWRRWCGCRSIRTAH
jgi:predicted O-linked N-acetylglucosamine transferase (SPINDLY family)